MKKLFLLLCVTLVSLMASAQVTWNVKGGAGYGNSDFCAKAGLGMEIHLSNAWSIMPSLEVAWRNVEAKQHSHEIFYDYDIEREGSQRKRIYNGNIESEYENDYDADGMCSYLQIPILAAYRIRLSDAMNMKIKAGPYFAYKMGGDIQTDPFALEEDVELEPRDFDMGLNVGLDFEARHFIFGVEAECGLKDTTKGGDYSYSTESSKKEYSFKSSKTLAFYATIGWIF